MTSTASLAAHMQSLNQMCERCVSTRRRECTWNDDPQREQCDACFKATKDPMKYKIPCVPAERPQPPSMAPMVQNQPRAEDRAARVYRKCGVPGCTTKVMAPIDFCALHMGLEPKTKSTKGGPRKDDDPKPKKDRSKMDRPSGSKKVRSSK